MSTDTSKPSPLQRNSTATPFQKLALVALGLAVAGAGLVLLEIGLRFFHVGEEALYGDPFVGFAAGRPLFEKKSLPSGEVVFATTPEKTAYFNYQEFPAEKGSDTFRVFSLGGSTTAGRPYDDRVSFNGWLRRYLEAADPSRPFEVVNTGAISYASYRIVLLMKELVRYSPDLFVVYTGHNEFLEERAYPPFIHRSLALKRIWIWLNGLRSYALTQRFLAGVSSSDDRDRSTLAGEVSAKPDDWTGVELYRRDADLRSAVIAHFEYNLLQMASIARANDVDIVFIKPVSNLKDFSPFKSEHRAGMPPAEVERFEHFLSQGRVLLDRSEPAAAVEVLGQAAALDSEYAEVHFRLGQAHLGAADYERARDAFVRAKELDVAPLRSLEAMATLVEHVATSTGSKLIDLQTLLEADSRKNLGHRILGNRYLLDHVHPDISVHSQIGEELLDVLISMGAARPVGTWTDQTRRQIYDDALANLDRNYYAERDLNLAKVLGWAGKTEESEESLRRAGGVLTDNAEVFLNLGILLQQQQRWAEAEEELSRAIELEPESAPAYFNLGVVYAGLGRTDDGVAALRRALDLQPDYPEALYNLGILQSRGDRPDEALSNLRAALDERPDAPEIHFQLGVAHRALGEWRSAAGSFEKAVELDPQNAEALVGLASIRAHDERPADAETLLRRAIAINPGLASARFDLGVVLAGMGRTRDAIEAYEAALEIDPELAQASNNLGILLAAEGDLQSASQAFLQAIETAPDYAEAYFNLGVVYDSAGRPGEGIRAIGRAIELDPEVGRFHLAFGILLTVHGNPDRARFHLGEAERLGEVIPPEIRSRLGNL